MAALSCRKRCVAGGTYGDAQIGQVLVEAWNGTAWTAQATQGDGTLNSVLAALSCRSPSGCTGVGSRADRARGSLTLAEATP